VPVHWFCEMRQYSIGPRLTKNGSSSRNTSEKQIVRPAPALKLLRSVVALDACRVVPAGAVSPEGALPAPEAASTIAPLPLLRKLELVCPTAWRPSGFA